MRTLTSYEQQARQAVGAVAPPNVFFREEDPNDPEWVINLKNMAAFQAVTVRPRVLIDVTERSLTTEVLGQTIAFPVIPAPVGWLNRFHPDAERAVARAAHSVGTIMTLSTGSSTSMEDVAQAAEASNWFQLYSMNDRKLTEHLAQRAEAAGFSAIVLTVDEPSIRPYDGVSAPNDSSGDGKFGNFDQSKYPNVPLSREEVGWFKAADFKWSEIEWLRSATGLPLVLKGIQTAEDAILAEQHGVSGIVISNHGGHTSPGVGATLTLLPEIADVVGEMEIYLDGGVRSGSDVLKAVAMGVRAVLIGRPMLWGLAVDGEAGLKTVLEAFRDELSEEMGLCGITDIRQVDRGYVRVPSNF